MAPVRSICSRSSHFPPAAAPEQALLMLTPIPEIFMPHQPNVFTPKGTPLLDRTVGELVAERPGRSRIFQAHEIGFCCQGSRTLREACHLKQIDPLTMERALIEEQKANGCEQPDFTGWSPRELGEYLVQKHHGFLRSELPRLHAMSERVAHVHGGHTPSLVSLYETFSSVASDLVLHVEKTERELIPALPDNSQHIDRLEETLSGLAVDHSHLLQGMEKVASLTGHFNPPSDACNTYRALFAGLKDLDGDLKAHFALEDALLFPSLKE